MCNISFVGGDNRNLILVGLLKKKGFEVYTNSMGMDNECTLEECVNKSNYIITSIPFSTDLKNINTPKSINKINIDYFIDLLKNKTIIGGKFSKEQCERLERKGNTVIDLMQNESLALKNTIPTVEGIVKIIIENNDITIDGSNIAIIGFGRIGKRAAKILNSMGANIFCSDSKKEEVANIRLCGYNVIENICKKNSFDVIINTVPQLVIGQNEFNFISKQVLIIDVASKPGGVDFNFAEKNGYKVIHALGIPGKVAPLTAAKYIEETIINLII